MLKTREDVRNIAIIAHVDHGKTTLVDQLLKQSGVFRSNQAVEERVMDSNDIEKERGITILSKNTAVTYKDTKINIIDTPGHADFGGEVERVLKMVNGVLVLVDACEGPMPQTRFVLQKALQLGLKPIVVINKVDKPNCRPDEVQEEVFDLMFNLDATEEQLDFPTIYGSAKNNWMSDDWNVPRENDITPVLDAIIKHIPEPRILTGTPQMLITSLDFSSYVGRIAIGRIHRGLLSESQDLSLVKRDGSVKKVRIKELRVFEGFGQACVREANCGELCALVGIEGFDIGDTICDPEHINPLPPIVIEEPTLSMNFVVNSSPFAGQSGKFLTNRHIKERLDKELEANVGLRVEELIDSGVERISSNELSVKMNVTASQIRQDLNNFGGFGQQGYGYNVEYLYSEIGNILGLNQKHQLIMLETR